MVGAWRASHYVAAGTLAAGMLVWAAHEAWPSREVPVALPIVVTSAYDEWADTLGRREMLSDVLMRAGITGREYVSFLKAKHTLNPRRMQPGLIFEVRRLKGTTVANRLGVRLDPERHLVMTRLGGDSGWLHARSAPRRSRRRPDRAAPIAGGGATFRSHLGCAR